MCIPEGNFKTASGAAEITAMQHWFAVYTLPRHEKRIAQHFQVREIEHFLPLYGTQRNWRNRSRHIVQLPLFPNYIFVRINREKRVLVLGVPGVLSIIGDCNESFRVTDNYMQFLRESLAENKVEPHPYLVSGERVRVKTGALAGMEGVLIRRKSGFRVVVTLELIKRSLAVEFDIADIEPCSSILLRYTSAKTVA